MRNTSRLIFGAAGIGLAGLLYRRYGARRPCPSYLSWMLENPFMNSVAGTSAILDRLALEPGMSLLDVGCGPGRLTIPAAQRVGTRGSVTALDIQPAMLERLRKKVADHYLSNIRLIQGGAGEGKLEQNAFDRALLVTVLGEIPDRKAALSEIFQALKPGGILSITEVLPDPDYQRRSTVVRLASEAGFEEQASFGGFPAYTIHFAKPIGAAL